MVRGKVYPGGEREACCAERVLFSHARLVPRPALFPFHCWSIIPPPVLIPVSLLVDNPSYMPPSWYMQGYPPPLYMPPPPFVGVYPAVHARSCTVHGRSTASASVPTTLFSHEVGRERPPRGGKLASSQLRITEILGETDLKGPRNPTQRVTSYKAVHNLPTPPDMLSRHP